MTIPITFNDEYLNKTVNKDARKPGERYKVRCWHETANGSGNPRSTLNWNLHERDPKTGKLIQSSYDVLIARDGEIWRYVDWTVWNSWSEGASTWVVDGVRLESGALGRACLGIELDGANDGKQKATAAQIESAARFAIYTSETEGIPLDRNHDVTHAQIAPLRKTDPRGYTIAQIYEAIAHLQQTTAPDYPELWGTAAPYTPQFGIPIEWRKAVDAGKPWGRAVSQEFNLNGGVVQFFEQAIAHYVAGRTTVYRREV